MPLINHNDVAAVSTYWRDWAEFGFSRPSASPSRAPNSSCPGLTRASGAHSARDCRPRPRMRALPAGPAMTALDLDVAEQGLERGVQGAVGCQHRTRLQHGLPALEVADVAARFL